MDEKSFSITTERLSFENLKKFFYFAFKRIFDLVISFIGLILLLPLLLFVKICYILSGDFHSIFFVQNRIGKNGKEFKLFKFRTMVPGADEALFQILSNDRELAREYKINKKLKNDPRITNVGKFLRKASFDELPQLINVFLGDMSMIGNRPYLPREREDMGFFYDEIVKIKPGITGYWQVSGRSDTTFDRRLELEMFYSNNYSFRLDLYIFLKTFMVVFGMKTSR